MFKSSGAATRAGLAVAMAACLLGGCGVLPERPFMNAQRAGSQCGSAEGVPALQATPEVVKGKYTLHFVELDDQGWAFPDAQRAQTDLRVGTPSRQIDCAIADLRNQLEQDDGKVLSFVYVHGWNHSARNDDRDVDRFRKLLSSRAEFFPDRKIVGIYVGWQGKSVDVPGLNYLTFWGRKNAAHHVSEGRVRELFSRIRGLRAYWNGRRAGSATDQDCDWEPSGNDRCKLRTIMIGHSFGGLILFSSAAPYLLETLTIDRDLPPSEQRPRAARARGIADLIVLLNPAFEGSRYDPIFNASLHYKAQDKEPPLLVMLTSDADWATKKAFPVARWFNSIFQYPATSDEQWTAMRRTPGHIDRYLTHKLCLGDKECADPPAGPATPVSAQAASAEPGLSFGPSSSYCDGLTLREYVSASPRLRPVVWNVRTHAEVIPDHNGIDQPAVYQFISQIYGDVAGTRSVSCGEAYPEARLHRSPDTTPAPQPQTSLATSTTRSSLRH